MDPYLDAILAVLVAMLSAASVGAMWFAFRRGRERLRLLTDVRTALLGREGLPIYGVSHARGLVERLAGMEEALGRNGGSTVFERLEDLAARQKTMQAHQQAMLDWQTTHIEEGNAIAEAMSEAGQRLADVLEQAGLEYDAPEPPRFSSPHHANPDTFHTSTKEPHHD